MAVGFNFIKSKYFYNNFIFTNSRFITIEISFIIIIIIITITNIAIIFIIIAIIMILPNDFIN